MKQIIDIQLAGLMKRLEERKIHVELTDAAQGASSSQEGYDPAYGARPLKRTIQRRVLDPLALRVLEGEFARRRHGRRSTRTATALTFEKRRGGQGIMTETHGHPTRLPRSNPRGGDRRGRGPLGTRPASSLWYGLALLLLLGARRRCTSSTPAGRPIPYSEFKALREAGPGRRGRPSATRRFDGTLKQAGATTEAVEAVHDDARRRSEARPRSSRRSGVKYTGEVANRWLPELLGWILPLLFFVAHLGLLLPPHGRRRGRRHVVRAQPREDLRRRRREGALRRRRRRGRGRGRAEGDRRVPEEPEEVHEPRRPDPEGRAARRPAGHRQDAAGARRRRRGARARSSA